MSSARKLCQMSKTFRVDAEDYVTGLKKFNDDDVGMGRVRVAKQMQWMMIESIAESLDAREETEVGGKLFCAANSKHVNHRAIWLLEFATPVPLFDALQWVQIGLYPLIFKDGLNVPAWAYVIPISQGDYDASVVGDLDAAKDLVTTHAVVEEVKKLIMD